jgi:hypothetical protein
MTGTRLNDCTPAPDGQAKYADVRKDEREAALLQTFVRMNEALARVTDERDAALAEIARLRATPDADVMEIVRDALTPLRLSPGSIPAYESADRKLCAALTAYGDRRAHDARQQILVDSTPLRKAVAREAREAALEEAAQVADRNAAAGKESYKTGRSPYDLAVRQCSEDTAWAIRALAAAPPQSEERHLTPSEHKVMNRALLRSVRPVDPPQSEGGEG